MRPSRFSFFHTHSAVALAVALLLPAGASADLLKSSAMKKAPNKIITGSIGQITVPPIYGSNPVYINQPLSVNLQGSGMCAKLFIDWGEPGKQPEVLQNVQLPRNEISHSYPTDGYKQIRMWGQGCIGQASGQMRIVKKPSPFSVACPKPVIKGVKLPNGQVVMHFSPGTNLLIQGCGFGQTPGRVRASSPTLPGLGDLKVTSWSHEGVHVFFPHMYPKKDHVIYLQTWPKVPKLGSGSNKYQLTLRFKRNSRQLLHREVTYVCGNKAAGSCPETKTNLLSGVRYMPKNYPVNTSGPDMLFDSDVVRIRLLNGWTISKVNFKPNNQGGSSATLPDKYYKGMANVDLRVLLKLSRTGKVIYYLDVEIEGPNTPATQFEALGVRMKKMKSSPIQ